MSWTVGLTGGIASGKSTVASLFATHGVPILDADDAARDAVAPGTTALTQIVDAFGHGILRPDRSLDRSALRRLVFHDASKRETLESIVHPAVRTMMRTWQSEQNTPYCMLVIPLLVESGLQSLVQRVLVVDAPRDTQHQRLMLRDDIDHELADRMIAAQLDRGQRLAAADDVIDNTGASPALTHAVEELHQRYLRLSQGKT